MSTVNAKAKVDTDPVFEEQVTTLRKEADDERTNRPENKQTQWCVPEKRGWSGDLFDYDGMSDMFDRSQANEQFVQAVSSPDNPGVAGDLVVGPLQADYLAIMERAFRARHTMRRPRAVVHAMGRKLGHGHEKGTFVQTALEYVRSTVAQSRSGGGA
jgi:hypothetical protein